MNQVLNIFRKDLRRCQWEIAVAVLCQLAVALLFPYKAIGSQEAFAMDPGQTILHFLFVFGLSALTQLAYILLVVKLVHTENLVGDTQFWLTRPYEWPLLLAAKLLSVVLFIYVPLTIVLGLVVHAANRPEFTAATVAHFLLGYTALFLLPLFALATVTPNFVRLLLTGIGATVAGIVALMIVRSTLHIPLVGGSWIELVLLLGLSITVIIMQYATRSLQTPRLILLAVPLVIFTYLLPGADTPTHPRGNFNFQYGTPPPERF